MSTLYLISFNGACKNKPSILSTKVIFNYDWDTDHNRQKAEYALNTDQDDEDDNDDVSFHQPYQF